MSVPSKYRISKPTAQPAKIETNKPVVVIPPLMMSDSAIDPITTPETKFHLCLDIVRATVFMAARPPISKFNGTATVVSVVPAKANSKRWASTCVTVQDAKDKSATVINRPAIASIN